VARAVNRRHVILVGLPGAGKTTVGRLAAALLDASFTDLDDAIESTAGKSVSRIFAEDGEPVFRALEASQGRRIFREPAGVIAVGGGFMSEPGNVSEALAAGLVIYLKVSAEAAAARLSATTGRPLLDAAAGDLAAAIRQLLVAREAAYLASGIDVTTDDLTPAQTAGLVAELAREQGGW